MPDTPKPTNTKDVATLSADEMGAEQARIKARMDAIAHAVGASANVKGTTIEEKISYLTGSGHHFDPGGNFIDQGLIGFLRTSPDHPDARKAETQLKEGDKYTIKKLGDLADEYAKLKQRTTEIDNRIQSNPSTAQAAKAAADKAAAAKAQTTSLDPVSKFQPQFLDDSQIQDLARTGQFDVTPTSIAAMFPSAGLQAAQATAKQQGTADPTTFIDKLAPEQYQDTSFVHTGDMPFQPNPQQLAVQRIKDQGLPAWEETALINQLTKNYPAQQTMGRDEYDQQRQAVIDKKLPWHEEIRQLNALKVRFDAGTASGTPTRDLNAPTSRVAGSGSNGYQPVPTGTSAATNSSLREVVQKPYSWTGDQVAATAVELFKGGYLQLPNYDPTKALSQQMHITSAFDPDFQKAYLAWVSDSFKDRTKSMMDILANRKESFLPQLKQLADKIQAAKPKLTIQVADAQGIRQTAETLAQSVAGFKLGDDEYQQLVSYIQGLQTNQQTAAFNQQYAPGATGGTTENVDVNARLEAAIRANHPVEAGAKDVADEADLMRSLFAGPVR